MQELRITQEMDGYHDKLILTDEASDTDNLLIKIEDDINITSIVLEKYHAKQIVSFLQNYFNL